MTIKRILVPVDFSASALDALDYAVDLAGAFEAEVTAIFVVEPVYYAIPDFGSAGAAVEAMLDDQSRSGKEQLKRIEERYRKRGVKLSGLLQRGTPYAVIADTAKRMKADMIIMSTHGRTGMAHLLVGSVTERVVRIAPCPVLTLHNEKRRRARPAAARRGEGRRA